MSLASLTGCLGPRAGPHDLFRVFGIRKQAPKRGARCVAGARTGSGHASTAWLGSSFFFPFPWNASEGFAWGFLLLTDFSAFFSKDSVRPPMVFCLKSRRTMKNPDSSNTFNTRSTVSVRRTPPTRDSFPQAIGRDVLNRLHSWGQGCGLYSIVQFKQRIRSTTDSHCAKR